MALPATPADTHDFATAVTVGFQGQRTDPLPDVLYTVAGGAGAAAPPKLTSVTPSSGVKAGATAITLGGSGLTGTEQVAIGQKLATTVVVTDDTHVTASTPSGDPVPRGLPVTVAKTGGKGSLPAGAWTYT